MTQKIDPELVQRIKTWFKGGVAPPYKFDVFFTHRCNLKCRFCNFPNTKNFGNELSDEKILDIVSQAGDMGAKIFGVLGGEPFLRKNAIELMRAAKNKGMAGSIVTNGTLLDEKKIREIIDMRWDLIRFSVDSPNSQTHDFLRGTKGSFQKTIGSIKTLQRIKAENGFWHPTVELNMVLCRKNLKDVPGMFALAEELGVKSIYFLPMIELVGNIDELKLERKESEEILRSFDENQLSKSNVSSNIGIIKNEYLIGKSNSIDKVILTKEKKLQEKYVPCFMPWYGMSVDAEGYVTPCGQVDVKHRVNVKDHSLRDIWSSEPFETLRKNMADKVLHEGCNRCCMPLVDENRLLREEL